MIVAGDHASNDMAGEDEDSWKSILEKEGFQISCTCRDWENFHPSEIFSSAMSAQDLHS